MTLRVGVVGAGLIGRRRAETVAGDPESRLVVVADVDGERAKGVAQELGCDATTEWERVVVRDDVDAVVVSTVNKFLMPIAIGAAERGKHVLCEKPLGRSAEEAEKIVQAVDRAGVTLKVGFTLRFHPAVRAAQRRCADGAIGKLLYVRAVYGHGGRPGYERDWRGDAYLAGGGELLDQGVHVVDLCRWFLGEFERAQGVVQRGFWDVAPLEDNGFAILSAADGRVATFHASWTQWKNRFLFEVIGTEGYVTVEGLGGSYGPEQLIVGQRRPGGGVPLEERTLFEEPDVSWRDEWREFADAVREGREPLSGGRDALRTMRLIQAIYDADQHGTVIFV